MRGYYGDTQAGSRLRRSRIAKGFVSAPSAASAFGWPLATYSAHEAGSRAWSREQLQAYAAAFDVPAEWLGEGRYPPNRASFDRLRIIAEAPVAEIAERLAQLKHGKAHVPQWRRLSAARVAKGFSSAGQAAAFFGWKHSTYGSHENGQNRLTEASAQRYGKAFGVSPQWLLDGSAPSGLANDEDPLSAEMMRDGSPGAGDDHGEIGRPINIEDRQGVVVPHLSDIPGRRLSIGAQWSLPLSIVPKEIADANLFALTVTEEFELAGGLRPNDVVLVLPDLLYKQAIAYMSVVEGDPQIHLSESRYHEDQFIGSVIAIIWRAHVVSSSHDPV